MTLDFVVCVIGLVVAAISFWWLMNGTGWALAWMIIGWIIFLVFFIQAIDYGRPANHRQALRQLHAQGFRFSTSELSISSDTAEYVANDCTTTYSIVKINGVWHVVVKLDSHGGLTPEYKIVTSKTIKSLC